MFTGMRLGEICNLRHQDIEVIEVVPCFHVHPQMPKNLFDHGTFASETQSPVDVFPITKMDRQVTPGNAGTVTIQNRSHKQTVIGRCSADMTFTTQKKIFYWPTLTCKSMVNHSRRLSLPVDAAYSAWNYRKNYGTPQNSNIEK
ncbi:hypothetical protein APT_00151 [Acetobacter pasteurianus NBRC 101655]|uniref:Tyr recombinase domain-containing protein n=1 Tax=Acetobacter pasteurianus (strain NBRC 105184 / IFO 3283-01) TaxID=634452 RepID=C7JB42_ACEP3|nr:hypothetical protein APA01_01630 [Acetobacter pasteurianus IFO 3283-01]BAI01369.1 hypothetical protein APA03_01630 [Acetobacter pasteurianus IFO 3283-03]BAI04417.1 hypothetical protein APA07_01630 [Acetobacter pasteurianus IFO 3283-07]BAI07464.1 hypothetical protein APA22_01630 [Acetobacter pasteurianus IFO 3283-22]BAI10512.1 hypothetical protein APA26_01630 [Acetobacter pasteurianus IFO 3283-26]BAI13560.1 hypothetical protein APA32_01630 [Acetobacter pasteurianus IFO 3283-32]BAI16606.1 hy